MLPERAPGDEKCRPGRRTGSTVVEKDNREESRYASCRGVGSGWLCGALAQW
jgi:hypothetical protein